MKSLNIFILSLTTLGFISATAVAGPSNFTYEGVLADNNDDPIANQNASVEVSIIDNNGSPCVLYRETHSVTTDNVGKFVVSVGSNFSTANSALKFSDSTFEEIFAGGSGLNGESSCVSNSGDRKLKISINGVALSPDLEMTSTPYSLHAADSDSLSGLSGSSFLRTTGTSFNAALSQSQADAVIAVANGNSPALSTTGTVNFSPLAVDPSASYTATDKGKIWFDNTTSVFKFWNGSSAVSIAPGASSLQLAGGTMTGAINMGGQDITAGGNIYLSANKYIGMGQYAVDPATGGWGAAEKGRTWFNTTSNSVKFWDGSGVQALGVNGAGLTSLGGQVGGVQTFSSGSTGTSPQINSSGNVHTLNVPLASSAGVTSGTISNAEYDSFAAKMPNTILAVTSALGYTPLNPASNLSDVGNATTARTNLGLGPSVTMAVGTAENNLVQLDGSARLPAVDASQLTGLTMLQIPSLDANKIASGTIADARMPAYSGDISVSAGTTVATISINAIDSSKIADASITNTDIAAGAAITRSKLANGLANHVVINDGTGVMSSEANLAMSRGGTGNSGFVNGQLAISNGTNLTSTNCSFNETLVYNGLAFVCEPIHNGDVAQGGNSFAAPMSIGTNDSQPLNIETNNTSRISIDINGKVGINTMSPSSKLDLNGDMNFFGLGGPPGNSAIGDGRIYFDSTAGKFKVSENAGQYIDLVPRAPHPGNLYVFEDFLTFQSSPSPNMVGDMGDYNMFAASASATIMAQTQTSGDYNHPGILRASLTGTSTNTGGGVALCHLQNTTTADPTLHLNAGTLYIETMVKLSTSTTTNSNQVLRVGFINSIASSTTKGVYLEVGQSATGGSVALQSKGTGSSTVYNTGTTLISGTWYKLALMVKPSGAYEIYINNILSISASIAGGFLPTAANDFLCPVVYLINNGAGVANNLDIDYIQVNQELSR